MKPYCVLSVDGGGIRGLHPATMLDGLARRFASRRQVAGLDVGKGFDLVVGTSTGGILACGLAYGCTPARLASMYRESGPRIFNGARMPGGWLGTLIWCLRHLRKPIHQSGTLRTALVKIFGSETLGTVYERRGIALCIPSLRLLNESPRVFKTGHLGPDFRRDDALSLVEVCLATAAAPIFLPLARVKETGNGTSEVFADGGLWMNNPTLVALLEALAVVPPEREIIIISLGTCPAIAGGNPAAIDVDRGLIGWGAGSKALELSMNAQAQASDFMLKSLVKELKRLGRQITVIRCHESKPSPEQSRHLSLDNASPEALGLLASLGENDAAETFRWVQDHNDIRGRALAAVFDAMPVKLNGQ